MTKYRIKLVKNVLKKATDRVRRGWLQDALHDYRGNVCALGAIECSTRSYDLRQDAEIALRRVIGYPFIDRWNDARGRTKDQVVEAFRKAIKLDFSRA